ncbi:MAG: FAD-binding protein, partial [Actinomycetota bacterium]|nr:FAD-binding protein [Actinomycetota bacterium]
MSLAALASVLEAELPGRVQRDCPLAPLTTYRLGGPAALLFEPGSGEDVTVAARALRAASDVRVLVLGRGSNTVVSDDGWPGLVVHVGPDLSWAEAGDEETTVLAGAGTSLPQLANWTA